MACWRRWVRGRAGSDDPRGRDVRRHKQQMKSFAGSILLPIALTVFELWVIFTVHGPLNPVNRPVLFALIFGVWMWTCVGGLWMLVTAVWNEEQPLPVVFLALLIPNSFLWYYCERVRPRRRAQLET